MFSTVENFSSRSPLPSHYYYHSVKFSSFIHLPISSSQSTVTRDFWPEKVDEHRLRMHEELSQLLAPHIQQVVEFAKRLPDFGHLGQPDQLILIKAAFFEVWMVQAARMVSMHERTITLADGKQITKQELDFVYSVSSVVLDSRQHNQTFAGIMSLAPIMHFSNKLFHMVLVTCGIQLTKDRFCVIETRCVSVLFVLSSAVDMFSQLVCTCSKSTNMQQADMQPLGQTNNVAMEMHRK